MLNAPKGKAWIGLDHVIDKYGTGFEFRNRDRARSSVVQALAPHPNGVPLASLIADILLGITAPPDQCFL